MFISVNCKRPNLKTDICNETSMVDNKMAKCTYPMEGHELVGN